MTIIEMIQMIRTSFMTSAGQRVASQDLPVDADPARTFTNARFGTIWTVLTQTPELMDSIWVQKDLQDVIDIMVFDEPQEWVAPSGAIFHSRSSYFTEVNGEEIEHPIRSFWGEHAQVFSNDPAALDLFDRLAQGVK